MLRLLDAVRCVDRDRVAAIGDGLARAVGSADAGRVRHRAVVDVGLGHCVGTGEGGRLARQQRDAVARAAPARRRQALTRRPARKGPGRGRRGVGDTDVGERVPAGVGDGELVVDDVTGCSIAGVGVVRAWTSSRPCRPRPGSAPRPRRCPGSRPGSSRSSMVVRHCHRSAPSKSPSRRPPRFPTTP